MRKSISLIGIGASLVVLAGCTSSTTYGTGSSHEKDTLKSIVNMLAVAPDEQAEIDYNARPDLVMPANPQALPAPGNQTASADENWPVSPEQRIAAVREAAPDGDWRGSEDIPLEYQLGEKDGIDNSARVYRQSRARSRSGGGDQLLQAIVDDANGVGDGVEARKRREELAYSTGVQRKFLTEPPSEYRVPSANAEAGDTGITREQLTAEQKKAREDQRNIDAGVITPGG
ncbi:MAG: hypothetical protein AAGA76_06560 [Pseudomonadota bacterium]